MNTAVFLGSVSVLDHYQIRQAIIRIPEIGIRLAEVQRILDRKSDRAIDIWTLLQQDDVSFSRLGGIRSVIVAAVQMGLSERNSKISGNPSILVGPKGTLQLLRAMAGNISFSELLNEIFSNSEFKSNVGKMALPQSCGAFDIIKITTDSEGPGFQYIESEAATEEALVKTLVEDFGIGRIVNVGPGSSVITSFTVDPIYERLQVIESIDADPKLTWFWDSSRRFAAGF